MYRHTPLLRILPAVAAALLASCAEQSDQRTVDLTVPVTVEPVALGTIEAVVEATGTLRPLRAAEVTSEIRGDLVFGRGAGDRPLAEGDRVDAGALLFELRNEEWVVGARLESHRLALESARRSLREKEALQPRGLATDAEVETARRTLADAESDFRDAGLQVDKTRCLAPIAGFVTGLTDVTEGTLVESGAVLCGLMDYARVIVDLRIPSARVRQVRHGQAVRVTNHAYPDEVFEGRITAVDPALDATTRTFQVEATVPNGELLLRPGMFVVADIVTESRRDVVLVPRELLLTRQGRQVVFVEEGARAQIRTVETGLVDGEMVEIVDGLAEGERLITSNYETLRSRSRVQVTERDAAGRR